MQPSQVKVITEQFDELAVELRDSPLDGFQTVYVRLGKETLVSAQWKLGEPDFLLNGPSGIISPVKLAQIVQAIGIVQHVVAQWFTHTREGSQ